MLDSLDTLIGFALIFTVVSLLITIVVQMVTSAFNLRGCNLAWGIAEAFEAIHPGPAGQIQGAKDALLEKLSPTISPAKRLADHCLDDTLISDSQFLGFTWRASAVRADELFDLLQRIATGKKPTSDDLRGHAINLMTSLGVPASVFEVLKLERDTLTKLHADLTTVAASLPDGDAKSSIASQITAISNKLTNAVVGTEKSVALWLAQGEGQIQQVYQKFEHWFETGQERAQEWFTMHARIITLILGFVFAVVLQLDAVEIFSKVSSNRDLRTKLVAQATTVQQQAEKVLGNEKSVLDDALGEWLNDLPKNVNELPTIKKLKADPAQTRNTLIYSAEAALDGVPEKDMLINKLVQAIDGTAKDEIKKNTGDFKAVKADLDNTDFPLFPKEFWKRWPEGSTGHVWGMIASALLLSLGAPFWFNLLKGLTSLRSTVAGNISDEKKAEQENTGDRKASQPPPTVSPAPPAKT